MEKNIFFRNVFLIVHEKWSVLPIHLVGGSRNDKKYYFGVFLRNRMYKSSL